MSWTVTWTTLRRRQSNSWSRSRKPSRSSPAGVATSPCAITSPHQSRQLLPASRYHRHTLCAGVLCHIFFTGIGCWQFQRGWMNSVWAHSLYVPRLSTWRELDSVQNCNQNMDVLVYFTQFVLVTSNLVLLFSFFALPLSILFGHFSGCFPPPFRLGMWSLTSKYLV